MISSLPGKALITLVDIARLDANVEQPIKSRYGLRVELRCNGVACLAINSADILTRIIAFQRNSALNRIAALPIQKE